MSTWTKKPDEVLKVAVDWTRRSNGAALVGVPVVALSGDAGAALVYEGTVGQLTHFVLSGGLAGKTTGVKVRIVTAAGETIAITAKIVVGS